MPAVVTMLLAGMVSCVKEGQETEVKDGVATVFGGIRQIEPEVKTSLESSVNVHWTAGDVIRVYNADFSKSTIGTASSAGASSEFTLDEAIGGNSIYAVYPASASSPEGGEAFLASAESSSGDYDINSRAIIFSTQRALADGFDPNSTPMVAVAGSDAHLTFVNLSALLKFTISGTGIASVVVESNSDTGKIAGSFYVQCKDTDSDKVLDSFSIEDDPSEIGVSSSITLLPQSGLETFAPGTYYVSCRPGATFSGGLRLTTYDASGNPMRTLANNSSVTLNRGKIRNLGNLAAGSDLERILACDMVDAASQLSTRTLATGIQQTDYSVTWKVNGSLPSVTSLMHVVRFDRVKATAAGARIRTMTPYDGHGVVYDGTDNQVRQSVRNIIISADTKEETVIFGTSGSENSSGKPAGMTMKNGTILYDYNDSFKSRPMVAVRANNNMYIGNYSNWASWTDANKATYFEINDGKYLGVNAGALRDIHNTARYGISAEGYTVRGNNTDNGDIYFIVVDNNGSNTKGATFKEVAAVMQSLGCYRAAFAQSASAAAMWTRNPSTHILEPLGEGAFAGSPISAWGITIPGETYATVKDAIGGSSVVKSVDSYTETTVKTGCSYTALSLTMAQGYNTAKDLSGTDMGDKLNVWVLKVDPEISGLSLKVLASSDSYSANASSFPLARLDNMAKAYKSNHTSQQPLVIFNGDFIDEESNIPRGPVHARGIGVKTSYLSSADKPQQGQSFVGIKSDGSIYIGDKDEYSSALTATYPELMGAGLMFLKDGKFNVSYVAADGHWSGTSNEATYMGKYDWPGVSHPRTAIGYDADGVIYVIWADGRDAGTSKGASYVELCEMFKSLGCIRATNLDGGQSSQFVKWTSGTTYSTLNLPRSSETGDVAYWRELALGLAFIE